MRYDPEDAGMWRTRAEELRARAESIVDADAKLTLLRLASDWTARADEAERRPWRRLMQRRQPPRRRSAARSAAPPSSS